MSSFVSFLKLHWEEPALSCQIPGHSCTQGALLMPCMGRTALHSGAGGEGSCTQGPLLMPCMGRSALHPGAGGEGSYLNSALALGCSLGLGLFDQ